MPETPAEDDDPPAPEPKPAEKPDPKAKPGDKGTREQQRDPDGKFGSGDGKGGSKEDKKGGKTNKEGKKDEKEDVAKNRPSNPDERPKNEDGTPKDVKPEAKTYQEPPAKTGTKGGGQIVRPTGEDSQTKTGDQAEKLALSLGFRNILPEGKRSHTEAEVKEKGSSIDLEYDHSGKLYELKMCNTTSTEYRLKAKADEKEAKEKFAKHSEAKAYVMIGVRDVDKKEIHYYAAKEPGMTGAEVSSKKYDYLGKASYA